jgi:hypothetical protein
MCDPTDWAKDVVSDTLSKAIEKPVDNLLGPVTTELGLTLGDVGSVFRFYVSDNLTRVFAKWAELRKGKTLNSSDIRRVLPLLQGASLQSDDELQERWAALLESTVESRTVLPSFGDTLSQLTAEEARYLSDLRKTIKDPTSIPYMHLRPEGKFFSFSLMMYVFGPDLSEYTSAYVELRYGRTLSSKQLEGIKKLRRFYLFAQDIERLGIIGTSTQLVPGDSTWIETNEKEVEIPGDPGINERKFFTPYGEGFIKAVSPKPH